MKNFKINLTLLYTGLIFIGQFTFSLLAGIVAPALIDLRFLIQNNNNEAVSLRSVALMFTFYFVGSILGSFISVAYKSEKLKPYINRQLLTSLLVFLFAVTFGVIPRGTTIWTLYILIFIGGIGCSNWNVVSTTWLIELWNDRPKVMASMLQVQQLQFGLGMIVAPIVMKPFLSGFAKDMEVELKPDEVEARRQSLVVPFELCAAFECAVGLVLLLTYLLPATRYRKSEKDVQLNGNQSGNSVKLFDQTANQSRGNLFKFAFVVIFTAFSLCELGHLSFQNTYFQLLPDLNITAQEAAQTATITAITYTVGRGLNVPLSGLLSPGAILNTNFALCCLSFLAFFWSQRQSRLWLSINSALIGYALSPIRSSMFAYVNTYTKADDKMNALFFISICIGSVFSPLLIGPYIEAFPEIVIYLDLASVGTALIAFIGAQYLVARASAPQEETQ